MEQVKGLNLCNLTCDLAVPHCQTSDKTNHYRNTRMAARSAVLAS
jgi:hypothetical protein